jgi:prolipoprotein diacylglyceryltransferase
LYESASCILLFLALYWEWNRRKASLPAGRLFGAFIVILFTLRFAYEFLKENQVDFEEEMSFNLGQLLSVPMILFGLYILARSYRKKMKSSTGEAIS